MANTVSVSDIRNASLTTSNLWTAEALDFLETLQNNAVSYIDVDLPNRFSGFPSTPYESSLFGRLGSEPSISGSTTFVTPSSDPGSSSLTALSTAIDEVAVPEYDVTSPVLDLPIKPQLMTPSAPVAPVLDDITIPASPTVELPTAPTLSSVAFPDAPTLSLPTFAEAAPDTPASYIQTSQFEWSEDGLDTPLLDAISSKLLTDVTDGGYGIESDDEDALWSRTRDRELIQLDAVETETQERYANKGFSLPPGAMVDTMRRVRAESEQRIAETNREIAIKRADLFRDNRQFSMTQGASVENIYLQHYGFRLERLLNAQRFAAEYSINVHDAYIRQFNAELQRYSTLAEVYRTQLQGALIEIQIYEAEVRSAVAKLEANKIDVDLYQALLEAATTRINLYEAQVRAASVVADIQRLKVESYRSEVQAFATRISANESQLSAYRTEISGEQAKVDIFRSEVGAYSDRVQAARLEQDIASEKVNVTLRTRQSELDEYRANIAKYQQDLSAETQRINSILSRYSSDTGVFQAAVAGYEALARIDLQESDATIQAYIEDTKRLQENARLELDARTNELNARFTSANAGAALAAGIVKAINTTFQGVALENQESTGL